jgi:hypothetical protein
MTTTVSVPRRTIDVPKEEPMYHTDRPTELEPTGCPARPAPAERLCAAAARAGTRKEEPRRWTRSTAS